MKTLSCKAKLDWPSLIKLLFILCLFIIPSKMDAQIELKNTSTAIEEYAAKELQRYYYQLSGQLLNIEKGKDVLTKAQFVLTTMDSSLIETWIKQGKIKISKTLKEQSYIIKTVDEGNNQVILIAGSDPTGLLYGVYGLLEDHLGMRFYMSGDVFPEDQFSGKLPYIDEEKTPQMAIRGFLPWTNFPQSATIYSWNDWRFIIDQAAKMRMNFILVHNYNAFANHNEMFHNFEYKGHLSRGWMPTIKTGHGWQCPPWEIEEYRFGASEIYDDYDFGADYGLHNETLSNIQIQDKGSIIFRKVIDYAHQRSVKIGLGLDIDVILPEYQADAYDTDIIEAQVKEVSTRYPDLDYLFCFQSESVKDSAFYARWNTAFDGFYSRMKTRSPNTRIAVAGWGVTPESVAELPKDVICAPISHYSATFQNGDVFGDREYWGCPWLERDFNSSQYYYPYNVDLSETIKCYNEASENMSGFYALTWRLTDAISPKLWYMSKAPWYDAGKLDTAEKVYRDFAQKNYGKAAEDDITLIINQNEPFATDFAECVITPKFDQMINTYALLNLSSIGLISNSGKKTEVAATNYSSKNGTQNAENKEGGECVGYIIAGNWLKYDEVNFDTSIDELSLRVASASSGGVATLTLDSLKGKIIAKFDIKNTEGWQSWKTIHSKMMEPVEGRHTIYISFSDYDAIANNAKVAQDQIATIGKHVASTNNFAYKQRLTHLSKRIEGVAHHIDLNANFNKYTWNDYPGKLYDWARSFLYRIDDISSFGNIMSTQNRFVQQNYISRIDSLRRYQQIKTPSHIVAKGTQTGAVISWKNQEPAIDYFKIYRNKQEIGTAKGTARTFHDTFDGEASYSVLSIDTDGNASLHGIPDQCFAGGADVEPPLIILTSPITSIIEGQNLSVKISVVENRHHNEITPILYYRQIGTDKWQSTTFEHKVRSTFTTQISAMNLSADEILEYYIEVSDGKNTSIYPALAPQKNNTVVVTNRQGQMLSRAQVEARDARLVWDLDPQADMYRIYRSKNVEFDCTASTFVTFVAGSTKGFRDNGFNFDGTPLKGTYYYKVTAVDHFDNESEPSILVIINYK